MKSRQFCSVCKEWLEMEVVPTGDGEEDDGVIWFRCPQCQGFLPKLSGAELRRDSDQAPASGETAAKAEDANPSVSPGQAAGRPALPPDQDNGLPWDSPADMMEARRIAGDPASMPGLEDLVGEDIPEPALSAEPSAKPQAASEPIHEYAALLEATDQGEPTPYRPWETYDVGQCILHQAWEDCGVVVAKEKLPGGRQIIKCYFTEAGVVRLIEKAPR